MGRLIDTDDLADAIQRERDLLIEREQYGAEHILVHHFERILEDVPTVDAIPVEWMRKFDLYYTGISGGSPYMKELIEVWQKEQEVNTDG